VTGYQTLVVERRGPIGWLVFDRPDAGNAMNARMFDELEAAWTELDADGSVYVIVNTGRGRFFQTGVDVRQVAQDRDALREHSRRTRDFAMRFTAWQLGVTKPVVAAVNGVCAGGGLHFVADADIVIAASSATFLDPHVSVGQVATFETIGLRVRMPFEAVARMALVGRYERITAARAYELGMVSQVIEPPEALKEEAQKLAELIARNSPSAMMITKKALWDSLEEGLTPSLSRSAQALADFWRHPDNREGPAAFAEKREPQWAPPSRDF
jgi:enoyl-CoA hydratase